MGRVIARIDRGDGHELRVMLEPAPAGERVVLQVFRSTADGWKPLRSHRVALRPGESARVRQALEASVT